VRGQSSRRLPEKCLRIKFAAGSPQVRLTLLLLGLLLSACSPIPASPALQAPGTPVPSAGAAASPPSEAATFPAPTLEPVTVTQTTTPEPAGTVLAPEAPAATPRPRPTPTPLPRVIAFGHYGSASGELAAPSGVAVTSDAVFVAERDNHRVQRFTLQGQFVWQAGSAGSAPGQLSSPTGIAAFNGLLYVADTNNHRIQVVDIKTKAVSTLTLQGIEPVNGK